MLGIVLLLTAPRDTMYIQKVNAFGVVFILCFLAFIVVTGWKELEVTEYTYSWDKYEY